MLINKLYINDKIFCNFHHGLNIIIAYNHKSNDTDELENRTIDTNGVGKSLIVNLVKKVLGGDTETILSSSYFEKKKILVNLEISDNSDNHYVIGYSFLNKLDQYKIVYIGDFSKYQKEIIGNGINQIETPFDFQKKFKDNPNLSLKDKKEFTSFINQLENIDYHKSNITFNSLLDFIIRDEKNGFSDIISRIRRSQKVQYRSIQYLFNLPYNIEEKISDITQSISDNTVDTDSKRKNLKENGITSNSSIDNLKIKLKNELENVHKDKETLKSSKSIESIRKEYKYHRENLIKINDSINTLEHQIKNFNLNLTNIKEQESDLSQFLDIESFFKDLTGTFPNELKSNFTDYQKFIESISKDRTEYIENTIFNSSTKLKEQKKVKSIIQKDLDSVSSKLKSLEIVDDITLIGRREEEVSEKLSKLDDYEIDLQKIETLLEKNDKLESDRKDLIKQAKKVEKKSREERSSYIEFFQEIITNVYGKPDCYLNFDFNSDTKSSICGRTEIECSIPSDMSHGRSNSKICLFDLTWFLKDNDLYNPNFLIHDGPYSKISKEVKHKILQLVIKNIESQNKQYIITINESELPYLDEYEEYISKELNGSDIEGKFFGEQFDGQ